MIWDREKFIEKAWEWKAIMHARITNQHRQLGISCDWERERFTLDDNLSRAVRVAFHTLYEQRSDLPRTLYGELVPAL